MATDADLLETLLDSELLRKLLLLADEAKVEYFRLGELEIRFKPTPVAPPQMFVPPVDRGVKGTTDAEQSPYHKLFAGSMPRLGTEE